MHMATQPYAVQHMRGAAHEGHTTVVQQLLAAHASLSIQALANAADAAAAAGHAELAVMLLQTLVAQDGPVPAAAIAVLAKQPVAAVVLGLWEAAEGAIREEEERWPKLQQLMIGIAGTHQQLQLAKADSVSPAIGTGVQDARQV
mgnify:CR=1 FL=1